GLTCSAFLAGVSGFPSNQQLEAANYLLETYVHHSNKKIRTITRSDFSSIKLLLPSLLPFTKHPTAFGKHRVTNRK
ncbi:hypothetical protein, partial [Priestia megaterium]|uniref:hypothetical protein n=1 Tax=Priestia megaterium TaxID=1404 RepID=UPI001C3F2F91